VNRAIDVRYFGEAYEIRIDMPSQPLTAFSVHEAIERFHAAHEALYGYSYRGAQLTEIVNLRVTGIGVIDKPGVAEQWVTDEAARPSDERPAYFGGRYRDAPVYHREDLRPGNHIVGPAIVEEYGSTTVIQPDQTAHLDRFGNLLLGMMLRC
jgi:N-methylhydantoinase A